MYGAQQASPAELRLDSGCSAFDQRFADVLRKVAEGGTNTWAPATLVGEPDGAPVL